MAIEIKDEVEKTIVATGAAMQQGPQPGEILVTHCVNAPGQSLRVGNHYTLRDTATGVKTAATCLSPPGGGMMTATFQRL